MSDKDTQTVVTDADTQAKPASEAEGARTEGDDLEALLADFDSATKPEPQATQPAKPAATPQTDPNLDQRLRTMEGALQRAQEREFKEQIGEAVKAIRGDISQDLIDDDLVEAWLDAKARKDPRLSTAWLQKDQNPRAWQRIQTELGREFKKRFDKMPDRQVTEDRDAVTAAVRGSSTKAPTEPPPNLGRLSTHEYREHVRKEYGFDPGV